MYVTFERSTYAGECADATSAESAPKNASDVSISTSPLTIRAASPPRVLGEKAVMCCSRNCAGRTCEQGASPRLPGSGVGDPQSSRVDREHVEASAAARTKSLPR